MANEIYNSTWWGSPQKNGWGGSYYDLAFPYTGAPELVINGSFTTDTDWTKEAGWTIAGGVSTATAATGGGLIQAGILTIGQKYTVSFDVSGISGDSLTFRFGTTNIGEIATNGTFTRTVVSNGTDLAIIPWNGVGLNANIDNVSIKETTEILLNPNMGSLSNWSYGAWSNILITTDANIYTMTVNGGNYPAVNPRIEQSVTLDITKTYELSALVNSNGVPFQIIATNGDTFVPDALNDITTTGYETISVQFTPTTTNMIMQFLVQGNAGQIAYLDEVSLKEVL